MHEIKFCAVCKKHTLKETCDCTMKTAPVYPVKYSPEDKYGSYRRKAKEQERKSQGTL
jgi:H/ACA ribonucleoprotein complex subunit 3